MKFDLDEWARTFIERLGVIAQMIDARYRTGP
ncbi:hypothetical protein LAUMK191_02904 [Mycobacterium attenuatum]|nr:hypothetical protein LAUMK191_02904 [Mycobacterium attenuatum]VBA58467.1 hypothetical protein LAUMK41_02981 [Mycobacterium attenuatum]